MRKSMVTAALAVAAAAGAVVFGAPAANAQDVTQMSGHDALVISSVANSAQALDDDYSEGRKVITYWRHGRANQRWSLERERDHTWSLRPLSNPDRCATATERYLEVRLTLCNAAEVRQQRWHITEVGEGVRFTNAEFRDDSLTYVGESQDVITAPTNNGINQQWRID